MRKKPTSATPDINLSTVNVTKSGEKVVAVKETANSVATIVKLFLRPILYKCKQKHD